MNNLFSYSFVIILVITIIISIISSSSTALFNYSDFNINTNDIIISSAGYTWPLPRQDLYIFLLWI